MLSGRVLIVDGYNVLHSSGRYTDLAALDIDAVRAVLIRDVELARSEGERAIVVFDGGANPASDGATHRVGEVEVVFSAYGHDADEVVESIAASCREMGDAVTVVTSDAETQWVALGQGAERVSSSTFVANITSAAERLSEHNSAGSARYTIGDRIDGSTKDALARWARGED